TIGMKTVVDFRLGYFKYKVNVLPFDFGTTPASDAGIQGLNLDKDFTSGLPAGFINGSRGFNFGSGLGVNRCNCPLDEDEKEGQWRHFYYAQDTWRVTPKVTLNYGLRADVINPQTVNNGQGGFLLASVTDGAADIPSPNIRVAGVGGIPSNGGIKNAWNWAGR